MKMRIKGSITVEASIVIPICLISMVTVLYLVIYMADMTIASAYLSQQSERLAETLITGEKTEESVKNELKENIQKQLILVKNVEIEMELDRQGYQCSLSCRGNISAPLGRILSFNFNISDSYSFFKQVTLIRNIRRVTSRL